MVHSLFKELCDGVFLAWRVVLWCVFTMESYVTVCC